MKKTNVPDIKGKWLLANLGAVDPIKGLEIEVVTNCKKAADVALLTFGVIQEVSKMLDETPQELLSNLLDAVNRG